MYKYIIKLTFLFSVAGSVNASEGVIQSLGGGYYSIPDVKSIGQVYGKTGMLHGLGVKKTNNQLSDDDNKGVLPSADIELVQLGVRFNGVDYVIYRPNKLVSFNPLENAEQSLLLENSPYKYNDGKAGQDVANIESLNQDIKDNSRIEFWYDSINGGERVYSSDQPEKFLLNSRDYNADLLVKAGNILDAKGDVLISNFSFASYSYYLTAGPNVIRSSSTDELGNAIIIYSVDSLDGSIDGVKPGAPEYVQLAMNRTVTKFKSPGKFRKAEHKFSIKSPLIVSAFIRTGDGNVFFPWASANNDGISHAVRVSDKTLAFETTNGGGDKDYQDAVFSIEHQDQAKSADHIVLSKYALQYTKSGSISKAANAVAIKDGVIVGMGARNKIVASFNGKKTKIDDRSKSYMYPGFVDSHEHIMSLGSVSFWDGIPSLYWTGGSPGNINTWENITETLISELVKFEKQGHLPSEWFAFSGMDYSKLGNPQGSTEKDPLPIIYKEAFTNPPLALTMPVDPVNYGSGNTYINWFHFIEYEAAKRLGKDPETYSRPIVGFLASGHGNWLNKSALEATVALFPKDGLDVLTRPNADPKSGQPKYVYDRIGGIFVRDGQYALTGYFTGLAEEPDAQTPIIFAFVASRPQEVFGKIGTHFIKNTSVHPIVGITSTAEKSSGVLTGTPAGDQALLGLMQSSGYQGKLRVFTFPLSNSFTDNAPDLTEATLNIKKLGLSPFSGNLNVASVGIKFVLDGSTQAFTARMPSESPYLVLDGFPGAIFDEVGQGDWEPIGVRDAPFPPPNTPLANNSYLESLVGQLYDLGWGVTAHTNGIQTSDMMIDAYNKAFIDGAKSKREHPYRPLSLQHVPLIPPDQVKRLAKIGARISLTAGHIENAYQWGWSGESFNGTGIVGKQRGKNLVSAKSHINNGVKISMHSDFPVSMIGPYSTPLDSSQKFILGPVEWMDELVSRVLTSIAPSTFNPSNIVNPEQRLSRSLALKAMTIWSAEELHVAEWLGKLEVGMLADSFISDKDLLDTKTPLRYSLPGSPGVTIQQTRINGDVVYDNN